MGEVGEFLSLLVTRMITELIGVVSLSSPQLYSSALVRPPGLRKVRFSLHHAHGSTSGIGTMKLTSETTILITAH